MGAGRRPAARPAIWAGLAAGLVVAVGAGPRLAIQPARRLSHHRGRAADRRAGRRLARLARQRHRAEGPYDGGRRRLWLDSGRAKFSVAKDPLRPFSVAAGDKLVVATGTVFSVERLTGQMRVVLYEGHVAVLDDKTGRADTAAAFRIGGAPADRLLTPDHELVTSTKTNATVVSQPDPIAPRPGRTASWCSRTSPWTWPSSG
jgi:transmembrane sensor